MGVKTVIILNQQSPILHFQHQQQGATLRASEVKPKLDRFIKEKIAGLPEATEAEKKIKQELYKAENFVAVKKEDLQTNSFDAYALNYKLRFENISRSEICEPADIYYGNMKLSEAEKTKTVFCSSVRMTLICFNSALLSYIEKHIEEFFVVTNFGRMQNKGFGSFTVAKINGEPTKRMSPDEIALCLKKAFGAEVCYAFDVTDTTNSRTNAFSKIKTLYSVMKSGCNFSGSYHHSFLFEYFHDKYKIGNEKAYMKKEKLSPYEIHKNKDGTEVERPVAHPKSDEIHKSEEPLNGYSYVRSLLGVGDHIDYITEFYESTNKHGKIVYKPCSNKERITIKHTPKGNEEMIERLCSPVFFKIIGNTVYFTAKQVDEKILGTEFEFINSREDSRKRKTPASFDIYDFLAYFVKKYEIDCRIDMRKYNKPAAYDIQTKIKEVGKNG